MHVSFDFHATRAKKARMGRSLLRPRTLAVINLLIAVGLVGSVAGFWVGFDLVGLVASPTLLLIVIKSWAVGELRELPAELPPQMPETLVLEDVLDRRVLGRIRRVDTPKNIWFGIKGMWRQRFFTVRYGLALEFFEPYMSESTDLGQKVWERAYELALEEGQNSITGAAITVALIESIPDYELFLGKLHLEPRDLKVGIDWQRHIESVAEKSRLTNN